MPRESRINISGNRPKTFWRGLVLAVLATALCLIPYFFLPAGRIYAQSPQETSASRTEGSALSAALQKAPELPLLYFGVKACATAGCHEKGQTADPPLLCRCDEMDRWKEKDKHADAFAALTGELGQSMLKKLKLESPLKATACLACHSLVVEKGAQVHDTFEYKDGISCVVCHGAHEGWVGKHSLVLSRKEFRGLDRQTKETKYGMTDLWNPVRRAQLCASCHIGNQAQGKFVTHEMYAAGHPPLPGFEITTFSDQMPRHWQYLREKPKEVQKIQGYSDQVWEKTQLLLVGSAVGLAESMRLLEAQAADALKSNQGLDWANFDCFACHHELRAPSWRQTRGDGYRPGRVPMKSWPAILTRVVSELASLEEAPAAGQTPNWVQLEKNLREAFVVRPFGDLAKIQLHAGAWARRADDLAVRTAKLPCGPPQMQKALKLLPDLLAERLADYDSARQAAWALTVLRGEEKSILNNDRADLDRLLFEVEKDLALQLPAGRKESIVLRQGELLRTLYAYDPEKFLVWMGKVKKSLK
jgi:hypothetical protein